MLSATRITATCRSAAGRSLIGVAAIFAGTAHAQPACEPARESTRATTSTTARPWENLFDGTTLTGWMQSGFEAEGAVKVVKPFRDGRGAIILEPGTTLSGITWTRGATLPRANYEITLEAMRVEGADFFCGLTFPVGKSACTLIVGGWGGTIVGLSSVDHSDASGNETSSNVEFSDQRWYRIRVRVTDDKIEAWIDNDQKVDLETKGRRIGLRPGDIQKSLPLGIASYMTRAAVRDIRLRRL